MRVGKIVCAGMGRRAGVARIRAQDKDALFGIAQSGRGRYLFGGREPGWRRGCRRFRRRFGHPFVAAFGHPFAVDGDPLLLDLPR